MKKMLVAAFAASFASGAFAQALNEGFNDVTTLAGSGWAFQNLSDSATSTGTLGNGWFQGNSSVFSAQSGAATSYLGVNFQSTSGGATSTISNWAFMPTRVWSNGDQISFWTRTVNTPAFPDRLQLRLSTNGASVNAGASSTSVGDFTNLLVEVNPSLTTAGYPNTWTQFSATITGLGGPTSGRAAFRYFVTNAGPSGDNSDYIGIDSVSVVPEPASMAVLGLGLLPLLKRRRKA